MLRSAAVPSCSKYSINICLTNEALRTVQAGKLVVENWLGFPKKYWNEVSLFISFMWGNLTLPCPARQRRSERRQGQCSGVALISSFFSTREAMGPSHK